MQDRLPTYVLDTHTLWWYLKRPSQLSATARQILLQAEAANGRLIVPAIVVAELQHVTARANDPVTPVEFFSLLESRGWIEVSPLGRSQLEYLHRLPEIPEMHDRLIAAEAIIHAAPLLTRDRLITASPQVETIW